MSETKEEKMKAKTKFLKWCKQAPEKTQRELVLNYWKREPFSLALIASMVEHDTEKGKQCIEQLGWEDG